MPSDTQPDSGGIRLRHDPDFQRELDSLTGRTKAGARREKFPMDRQAGVGIVFLFTRFLRGHHRVYVHLQFYVFFYIEFFQQPKPAGTPAGANGDRHEHQ